jgi:dTDP-4-amino-4,6-dideoxygalactose transaminase
LVTSKTKAIVLVHYAGVACDMDAIMAIARKHNIMVIEDAAHAIDAFYKGQALGTFGQMAAFSFHETKNVIAGEGGALIVNEQSLVARAEIIREKGTNRTAFFRGEVDKYNWLDIGSSYLPSEITAAFLYAQLENIDLIQSRRKSIWNRYWDLLLVLQNKGLLQLPFIPDYAASNGHMFYLVCNSGDDRTKLIAYLNSYGINAIFHYLSLHKSPYYLREHASVDLPNADRYTDCLVRLPIFYDLEEASVDFIAGKVLAFYGQ